VQRSTHRILTTHIGSLIRPPELVNLLQRRQRHEPYDEQAYDGCLKNAVAQVVQQQEEVGVDIVSDGEFGKSSWFRYLSDRLGGFEQRQPPPGEVTVPRGKDREDFPEFYAELEGQGGPGAISATLVCMAPIRYTGQAALERDISNFKAALAGVQVEEAFLPVAAPASIEPGRINAYYPTEEAYVYALADAMKVEYNRIVAAGLLLQVDDAWLPAMWDRMLPNVDMQQFRKYAALRIEALNHALAGIQEEKVRYHICWGSWNGPHTTDIPLKDIVALVLQVRAGGYAIEAANPRHAHEWQVWKDVKLPDGKVLIPGMISHATNIVEHPELVAWRIQLYASVVGRENVLASTDCGFAQSAFIRRVHPTIMWAKLRALAEGAALATKALWPN